MPWKKDLAKLKQELVKEDPSSAKAPPLPKAAPKTPISQSIEEEDAIFLSAMGLRPQAKPREAVVPVAQAAPPPLVRAEPPAPGFVQEEFSSAMGDLKGMKPMRRELPGARPAVPAPASLSAASSPSPSGSPSASAPAAVPPAPALEAIPIPEARIEVPPTGATEIHLAAGMAIEVSASLDLRHHGRTDGEERLKERILDGYAIGWRTLHVNVGPSLPLKEMLLELLKTPEGRCVARYAQAPIPMGGAQAWILYFKSPPPGENA